MKRLFRYQYDNETNYSAIILIAIILTVLWLVVIISQYGYYMERFSFKVWLAERVGMGIFPAVFWLMIIIFLSIDGKNRKQIMQNGKYYDGEIVGYLTKINIHYHNRRESNFHSKTYILYVKCRGETIITPPLRGNPERVLKSTKCRVYCYEGQKYVTDFDERFFKIGKGVSIPKI